MGNFAFHSTTNLQAYFLRHSKWFFFFFPGSIICKGQLSTCICWSAISKCADTGTDWRMASYQMLRDEGSRNTGSHCLSQRMCHLSFASTSISRDSSNKDGTCEAVLPDNFVFLLHTMITWSSLVTSILCSGWNTKGKERSNTVLPEKLWSKHINVTA